MKHRIGLYFAMAASLVLAGCSLAEPEDNYYRVDYYSDYVGVEEDYASKSLDKTKAILLGHAYAKKEVVSSSGEEEIVTYHGVSEPTKLEDGISNYRSTQRESPEGYTYKFDKWVGYYEDGTEIDRSAIKADCALFATYKLEAIDLVVSIEGIDSNTRTYLVKYGETLASSEEYLANPVTEDPTHRHSDKYYEESILSGVSVSIDDGDFTPIDKGAYATYHEAFEAMPITKKTKFRYIYEDAAKKSYTVKFKCVDESNPSVILNDVDESGWESQQVVYGEPLVKPASISADQWKYIDCEGEYSAEAKALDERLDKIDVRHIFYDCEVVLNYRHVASETDVNIYNDQGTLVETLKAYDHEAPALPSPTISANHSFTGRWVYKDSLLPFDPNAEVTNPIDVIPLSVQSEVTRDYTIGGASVELDFTFDRQYGGYILTNLDMASPKDVALTAAHLSCDMNTVWGALPYHTVAIQSFGGSLVAQHVTAVALPDTVTHIKGTAFRGCVNLEELHLATLPNLIEIGTYAFDGCSNLAVVDFPSSLRIIGNKAFYRCVSLTEVRLQEGVTDIGFNAFERCSDMATLELPSTLENVGTKIVEGCTSLTEIKINLTEDELSAKTGFDAHWNYNGSVGIPLDYKD